MPGRVSSVTSHRVSRVPRTALAGASVAVISGRRIVARASAFAAPLALAGGAAAALDGSDPFAGLGETADFSGVLGASVADLWEKEVWR